MQRRIATSATALLAATISLLTPAAAQANHSWNGYHWARTSNPFTVRLGDNVTSAWDSYVRKASADWSTSTVLNTKVVPGSTTGTACRPAAGRVEVCNASYGGTGWLGVASVFVKGKHITAGTVKLNDTYFAMTQYNKPAERQLVTCQEIGHTFGLAHQDESFTNPNLNTCMDYTDSPSSNQHPNAHDYAELKTIYAHLDATSTVHSLAGSPSLSATTPAGWGVEIAGARDRGHSTFVRTTGRDEHVVTFVTWAHRRA